MTPAKIKPDISIDDVEKLDIRAGTILAVEEIPDSRKLMKLVVDFGDHQRNILAAIKQEREDATQITGLQALFVLNLPPRKMAGLESQGMLFDIGYADGVTPVLALTEKRVPDGTRAINCSWLDT